MQLAPGDTIAGRYRLERLLGEGGMGSVWAATNLVSHCLVALKLMKNAVNDSATVRRFQREARAANAVHHDNVVQIHDVLEHEGQPVMVMDLLSGETLASKLARERQLSIEEFAKLMVPIVSAVGHAHAAGIVHRDLKPDNVFLHRRADGELEPKVLDFGIAKLKAPEGATAATAQLTSTGAVMGTPYYMAPEQVFGEKDLDHRADVWAIGVIAYECLAGRKPFDGDNVGQLFKAVITGTFAPLEGVAPHLPKNATDAIRRLLEVDRSRRAPDLRELYDILKPYSSAAASSFGSVNSLVVPLPTDTGPSVPDATAPSLTRSGEIPLERRPWLALGAAAVALVLGLGGWWLLRSRSTDPAAQSEPAASHAETPPAIASAGPIAPSAAVAEAARLPTLDAGARKSSAAIRPIAKPAPVASPATSPAQPPPAASRVPGTVVEQVPF